MKARGMDAVVSKTGRRKMALKRKGAMPGIAIVVGSAPPKPEMEEEDERETLVCPKCGAQLADTPKNKQYAADREREMADESEDEMDEESDEEAY